MYYMWLYEGSQWRKRAYAVGALVLVMIFVMFPLWPLKLRQGAWYLSMAFFGLIVLFFAMAIVRLILFCITMFTHAPGLWLFPNLFEDVGFVDSFIPLWAWNMVSFFSSATATNYTKLTTISIRIRKQNEDSNAKRKNRNKQRNKERALQMVLRMEMRLCLARLAQQGMMLKRMELHSGDFMHKLRKLTMMNSLFLDLFGGAQLVAKSRKTVSRSHFTSCVALLEVSKDYVAFIACMIISVRIHTFHTNTVL